MSGVLKRKFAEVDEEDPCYSSSSPPSSFSSPSPPPSEWESDGDSYSSDNQDFTPSIPALPTSSLPIRSILKRSKRARGQGNVRFDLVTVYLFPRCQGFTSVPSRGGATLGMVRRHSSLRRYSLTEHALERQRRCRERLRERLREERLEALRQKLTANGTVDPEEADRLTIDQVPDEELDMDAHISDADLEEGSFLHPYPSKQRQALLRAVGVKRIDREEKRQLHALRLSREDCGCDCQGFCEPETCACSLAGIKCQMDRSNFPCGCTKDGCGNTNGRIEFNSRRVQTHYIHTVMRLELERRLQDETLNRLDKRRVPEENQDPSQDQSQDQGHQQQTVQEKSCPFGFTMEEDGLPLTIPTTPTFHFSSELAEVGENSCSSDMTDSSCSSARSEDSDAGESPVVYQPLLDMDDGGLAHVLNFCDLENEDCSLSSESEVRQSRQPQHQSLNSSDTYVLTNDTTGTPSVSNTAYTHIDNNCSSSMAEYLDENANEATALFANSPLPDYPNTPSPSIDYSSSSYMDLSLSSDSDLEIFDNFPDCSTGPLHYSFKGHNHPDNFLHLQLLSSSNLPHFNEPSACLLESLIGLSESIPEAPVSFTDNQLFEEVIQ